MGTGDGDSGLRPALRRIPEGGSVCKRLARVVRLLFIPLANLLLQRLSNPPAKAADGFAGLNADAANFLHDINIRDCINEGLIDPNTLADLNALCSLVIRKYFDESGWSNSDRVFSDDAVLKCNLASLEQCVDDVFGLLFEALAALLQPIGLKSFDQRARGERAQIELRLADRGQTRELR